MQKFKLTPTMYIDNVFGICPECHEESLLIGIVRDFYKCAKCGEETRQFVNGVIKYMKLNKEDKDYIKKYGSKSQLR